MNNPLVSIITPAYNSSALLVNTIESVIKQTYREWEMLVIDDGSTDDTVAIARSIAEQDNRIKVFALRVNSGRPAVPRNFGIKQAKGDYIAFLDSDDLCVPERIERQVRFMEGNKKFFLSYSKIFFKEGERKIFPEGIFKKAKSGNIYRDLFLSDNFIICSTVMMRNPAGSQQYYFDEDIRLRAIEDFDLWLKVASKEKIGFINEPLVTYVVHPKNISQKLWQFYKRYLFLIKKHTKNFSASALALKYILLAKLFLKLMLYRFAVSCKKGMGLSL